MPAKAEAEATVTNNSPHVTNRLAFIYSLSGVIDGQRAGGWRKGGSNVARAQARARKRFCCETQRETNSLSMEMLNPEKTIGWA